MSEPKTPCGGGMPHGDFIPLEEAWEKFTAQCEAARIPLCNLCHRVRLFSTDVDAICKYYTAPKDVNGCLAKFHRARSA